MKEKHLSCFGLVFTTCSVLGRLLASYKHLYKHPNQYILEETLNIAGKPKRNKRRHKHLNQYILEQAYNCSRKIRLPAWLHGEPLE